jgi:hypothetical protein
MASRITRLKRMVAIAIPTSMAVVAIGNGPAFAAGNNVIETCPDVTLPRAQLPMPDQPGYMPHTQAVSCTSSYGGCFRVDGSDTLTDVVQKSIVQSGACISYHNVGSGQGETNLTNDLSGVTGVTTCQGVAPMSRNFTSAKISAMIALGKDVTPGKENVLALDAPVVTVHYKAGTECQDRSPGYVAGNSHLAPPNSDLAQALAGYPASGTVSLGTTAECSDPHRVAAVQAMADCQGVDSIQHIYRRDDKSGTQDTWREHLQTKYWCNGKSEGNTNAAGSNLKNEDLDPIRRPCVGEDANFAKTKCTFYPSTIACTAGDQPQTIPGHSELGTVSCTQGLIIALSETDKTSSDITTSIGKRVGLDSIAGGRSIGLAGLASSDPANLLSSGTTINTTTYIPSNIYATQGYMFSRLLFLMKRPGGAGGCSSGTAQDLVNRNTEEAKFYSFATTNCAMDDSIIANAGFLNPQDGLGTGGSLSQCGNAPCLDGNNIACGVPDMGVGTPKQAIGPGETGDSSHPCSVNNTVLSSPAVCPYPS